MRKVLLALLLLSTSAYVTVADETQLKQDVQAEKIQWQKQRDTGLKEDFQSWLKKTNPALYNQWTAYQKQNLQKYSVEKAAVDKAAISRELKNRKVVDEQGQILSQNKKLTLEEQPSVPLVGGPTFPYTQSLAWADVTLSALTPDLKKTPKISYFEKDILEAFRQQNTPQEKLAFLLKPAEGSTEENTSLLWKLLEPWPYVSPGNEWRHLQDYRSIKKILSEEVKHSDMFVVYRAQAPQISILFDLYSEILALARVNEHTTHRLVLEDLEKTIQDFYNATIQHGDDDHSGAYGKYGVTGSLSLLDRSSGESALYFWRRATGNVYNEIPFSLIKSLIHFIFGEHDDVDEILGYGKGDLVPQKLQKEHKLYKDIKSLEQKVDDLFMNSPFKFGNVMMQIFISPEIVDQVLWIAEPYGKKVKGYENKDNGNKDTKTILEDVLKIPGNSKNYSYFPPIKGIIDKEVWKNFQGRLYAGQKDFYNPKYVQTKVYYRNQPDPVLEPEEYQAFQSQVKEYKQTIHHLAKQLLGTFKDEVQR